MVYGLWVTAYRGGGRKLANRALTPSINSNSSPLSVQSPEQTSSSDEEMRQMTKFLCDVRFLLLVAAIAFIYLQVSPPFSCLTHLTSFVDRLSNHGSNSSFFLDNQFQNQNHKSITIQLRVLASKLVCSKYGVCLFFGLQLRLFATQSEYAERLATAVRCYI